jgi:hypothetical protein
MACKALAADPNLAGGFNSIGVSQVKTVLANTWRDPRVLTVFQSRAPS